MISFLGIGAQKAGTTWLFRKMSRHPRIAFPAGKEVHFWDSRRANGLEWYLSLFSAPDHMDKVCGEITPAYATLSPSLISACYQNLPEARLIYVLRNPIERAWSSAKMALTRAEMQMHEASNQWFLDHFRSSGSRMRGHYARCIANWTNTYPKEQLQVCFFEDLVASPVDFLIRCFRHVGVDESHYDWSTDLNTKIHNSPDHALPDRLRDALEKIYLPEIAELEQMLAVDLSAWRQRPSAPA